MTFERWDGDNGVCASCTALGIGRRERRSEQSLYISCHSLDDHDRLDPHFLVEVETLPVWFVLSCLISLCGRGVQ